MDAFDASPAATFVEDALVGWLAREHGLGAQGSGVMTMGGTASNLLGLLLARDRAGENVRRDGLPPNDWRIVASEAGHDSIRRSAALLGLGTEAVIGVETDETGAMSLEAFDAATRGQHVIAVVGTAGTTDLGAIDPLDALADRARRARRLVPRRRRRRLRPRPQSDASGARLHGHRARRQRHRRPAQAVVAAVQRQRAAGARRRRAARPSTTPASTSTAPRTRPRASSTSSAAASTRRGASTR